MTHTLDSVSALVQRIHILQAEQSLGQRLIVAIAGAPGSGKSTLAEQVCSLLNEPDRLNAPMPADKSTPRAVAGMQPGDQAQIQSNANESPGTVRATQAVVVPMDGFHLDNTLLHERGQMAVKGAPQTFDIEGFVALMQRLSRVDDRDVYIPVFDRSADLSRNAAQCVSASHSVIIVEGNYLLLQRPGWESLASLFHLRVMLDVPIEVLEERLVQRWLDHGLDADAARERALSNDIPNARTVSEESTGAHLFYKSMRQ